MQRTYIWEIVLICLLLGTVPATASLTGWQDKGLATQGGIKFTETVQIPSYVGVSENLIRENSGVMVNQAVLGVVFRGALYRGIWPSPVMDWFVFTRYLSNTWYPPRGRTLSELVYMQSHRNRWIVS